MLLRHTIDSAGSGTVELAECPPEIVDIEMVEQRAHLLLPTPFGGCAYPVQLHVPAEWSVFADLWGETELGHSPCPPSLHRHCPASSLLRGHLTSAVGIDADS